MRIAAFKALGDSINAGILRGERNNSGDNGVEIEEQDMGKAIDAETLLITDFSLGLSLADIVRRLLEGSEDSKLAVIIEDIYKIHLIMIIRGF